MTNKGREVLLQMLRDRVPAMGAALARARNDAVGMVDHLGLEGVDAEAKERSLILEDMGRYFAMLLVDWLTLSIDDSGQIGLHWGPNDG